MDSAELDAVDLITLLTEVGMEGRYEIEISEKSALDDVDDDKNHLSESFSHEHVADAKPLPDKKITKPTNVVQMPNPPVSKPKAKRLHNIFEVSSLVAIKDDTLDKISSEVIECENCSLCETRNKTVAGIGNPNAKLVLVGEAPGADEDRTGIPFVGIAGQHLDKILEAIGFSRDEVFICNILKCRPPGNRTPALQEMVSCTPFLRRQLSLIKPQLIACLGNTAIKYIIGPRTPGITRIHGEWFESIFKIQTMAMYHPSYLCRNTSRAKGSPNWQMWNDIKKLKAKYDSLT